MDTILTTNNIHIISYASRRFRSRLNILENQFNKIPGLKYKLYSENHIPTSFKQKIGKEIWFSKRGGGYWAWKIWIINDYLSSIPDNDILIYIDAGCYVNINNHPECIARLKDYIDMVNNPNKCGLLRFELPYIEKEFTNKYMWESMVNKYNLHNDEYFNTFQLVGGIQIMRKCEWVTNYFNEVMEVLLADPELITDKKTLSGEKHRHDQSLQSLLYKIKGGDLIIPDETYTRDLKDPEIFKIPFLALRIIGNLEI